MRVDQQKELERIHARDGALSPTALVTEAADPRSPLHECFTWDDTEAARRHRLNEARQLIRVAVKIIPSVSNEPVRQFVSISSLRKTETGSYLALAEVLTDQERYDQMLADALAVLNGLQRRYAHIAELSPVWAAIAGLSAKAA